MEDGARMERNEMRVRMRMLRIRKGEDKEREDKILGRLRKRKTVREIRRRGEMYEV